MYELHRQRAEEQAITVLLGSIDWAGDPVRWREAQRMAADELSVSWGLVFVERARVHFLALGGGELPPRVGGQRVLEPVATMPVDDALAPADDVMYRHLMSWLDHKES